MPLPAGLETVVVTIDAPLYPNGELRRGQIKFQPSPKALVSATEDSILAGPVAVTFDGASADAQTVELLATDAFGVLPTGWTYAVEERWSDSPSRSYSLSLPASAPTVNFADLVPTSPAAGELPTASSFGQTLVSAAAAADARTALGLGTAAVADSGDFDPAGSAAAALDDAVEQLGRVFTPETYGAVGDGTGDDLAAVQAAVTAAELYAASGAPATVLLTGSYRLANGSPGRVNLARNNDGSRGWINVIGRPGARVILTAQTPRFLHMNKVADYDTFQKIRVEGFEIDAGNVPGYGGVILGNVMNSGEQLTRLNFADIIVRSVRARNLYEEASTATSQRVGVQIIGAHPGALEATQTSTRNITVEDVEVYGGAGLANVCSFGAALPGGVNHYYDGISFRRCRHVIATPPATNGSQTSFFICGTGFGDYCEMIDCYSKNISDDGVEVGAMQSVYLERVRVEDAYLEHFLFRNFHALQDVRTQVITLVDPVVTTTLAGVAGSPDGLTRQVPFNLKPENPFGTIRLIRPRVVVDGQSTAHSAPPNNAYFFGVNAASVDGPTSVQALEVISPRLVFKNFVANRASPHDINLIYFHSAATDARLLVRDLVVHLDGLTVPTSSAAILSLIRVEGVAAVDIDGVMVTVPALTFTGGGGFRMVDLGRSVSGSNIRGRISGLAPKTGSLSGAGVYGVYTSSTATLTLPGELQVSESDFTGMGNVTSEVRIDTTQVGRVLTRGVTMRSGLLPAASVTPGASPYTYLNSTGYPKMVTVAGGTVSLIEVQGASGSFFSTGLTSGAFVVRPGHRVRVTYTVAPTVIEVPLT